LSAFFVLAFPPRMFRSDMLMLVAVHLFKWHACKLMLVVVQVKKDFHWYELHKTKGIGEE